MQAKAIDRTVNEKPGTVVEIDKTGAWVACADRIIAVRRLEVEGSIVPAAEILKSGQILA